MGLNVGVETMYLVLEQVLEGETVLQLHVKGIELIGCARQCNCHIGKTSLVPDVIGQELANARRIKEDR
jgi:hypothetical protein